ncbi:Outer membrane assembly protein, YaeT [Candidatus Magnetobacterium bavaricum]|uniref:Outer membrane protein assembly factor BamA n=1 Tax=Candidatus Magnetobacterium bavaricum TaxID=29290 RepID=A0A0F3GRV3_9BACT|nr:Outer membrane assembly protein, YaeT [Candidatus Magnetobacterium bavaricum]
MRGKPDNFFLLPFLLTMLLVAMPAGAAIKVSAVTVSGLQSVSEEEFLYMFGLNAGDELSGNRIRAGIRSAFLKGSFEDIKVYVEDTHVVIEVIERVDSQQQPDLIKPSDAKKTRANRKTKKDKKINVRFNGVSVFSKDTLLQEMPFYDTGSVTTDSVNEAVQTILSLYHQGGYINATVTTRTWQRPDSYDVLCDIDEGDAYEIADVVFEGCTIDKDKLKELMSLKKGQPLNYDIIEDEEDAITQYYQSIGFYDVNVDSFDIKITPKNKTAIITIKLTEGAQLKVSRVNITGNNRIGTETIMSLIAIEEGAPLDDTSVFNARARIISHYNKNGYSDATVKVQTNVEDTSVILTFNIEEGKPYVFGKTIISGNKRTKWKVFTGTITHKSGDAFNTIKLYEEVKDLYKTGLFTSVDFSVVDGFGQSKDVVFEVKEANHGVIDYGVGYGEYEGLRGFFDVKYINLGGMNRQISLRTKVSSLNQKYSLGYIEPRFTSYSLPLSSSISFEKREELDANTRNVRYQLEKYTASSSVERYLGNNIKGQLSYEFNLVKTWDVSPDVELSRDDTGTLVISSIVPSVLLDTRNNPSNPTDGFLVGASVKLASGLLLSQTNFIKTTGNFNYYREVFKDVTLALSLRSGVGQGWLQTVDLPIVERFFLGGSTNVRGYAQDTVGPKGSKGYPQGGNVFTMTNIEMRFKVVGDFGMVTFVDTGNVWNDFKDFNPFDVKYTTGLGLRYMTAIGPLRVDYGHKLNKAKDESPGRFYFSIGQAF